MKNKIKAELLEKFQNEASHEILKRMQKARAYSNFAVKNDLKELHKFCISNDKMPEFIHLLSNFYVNTAFFPNDKIDVAFRKIGFDENLMRWFIPIQDLCETIEFINNNENFLVNPLFVFECVESYIFYKIFDAIQKFFGFHGKLNRAFVSKSRIYQHKLFKKIEKQPTKLSDIELYLKKKYDEFFEIPLPFDKYYVSKIFRYKPEILFAKFLFDCVIDLRHFGNSKKHMNQKLRAFYPLARLVLKEFCLNDEKEFKNTIGNTDECNYMDRFSKYQTIRLKRILDL